MSGVLILPLTKSPHRGRGWKTRIGPKERQDYFQGLLLAEKIHKERGGEILVLTNGQFEDKESEADTYYKDLIQIGVKADDILVIRKGKETMRQITIVSKLSEKEGKELIIISTFLHFLRVRWLCRNLKAEHHVAWGIPRPYEAITDILLTFILPLIDTFCERPGRAWFLKKVTKRRGKKIL